MRNGLLLLICCVATLVGCAQHRVDRLLVQRYPPDTAGAGVAVVRDGSLLYAGTFGLADIEHRVPVRAETAFDVASVAKQFTAFAFFDLVSKGLADPDELIDALVVDIFPAAAGKGIRMRHLLGHSSGIRDYVWAATVAGRRFDDVQTTEEARRYLLRQRDLQREPGKQFDYNNTGYLLLAHIVEKKGGEPFAAYMKKEVFAKLGMRDTAFIESHRKPVPHRAQAYGAGGEYCSGWEPGVPLERCIDGTALPGPMSMVTTLPDMAAWLAAVQRGVAAGDRRFTSLFEPASALVPALPDCAQPHSPDVRYGGGMFLDLIGKVRIQCHGGTWRGYRALTLFVPDSRLAVVILSNRGDALERLRDTAFELIRSFDPATVLAVPPQPPWQPPACAAATATDLDGRYYSPELETTYTFRRDGGHLIASSLRRSDVLLCQWGTGDNFFSPDFALGFWLQRARFMREEGAVTAVEVSALAGAGTIRFVRLP